MFRLGPWITSRGLVARAVMRDLPLYRVGDLSHLESLGAAVPDGLADDVGHFGALGLLVERDGAHEGVAVEPVRHGVLEPETLEQLLDAARVGRRAYAALLAEPGRHAHADRDCLSVQVAVVARHLLHGVCNRVAEVEDAPQALLFALVLLDDVGL